MNSDEYQQQMKEQYEATAKYNPDESEVKIQQEPSGDAAAEFKREFWPADPFETGVFVDAANLGIPELVAIFRATKNLEAGGHQPFVNALILPRSKSNLTPMVRVNPLFVDACRQRKIEVCELLQEFFYGDCQTFEAKWQEIFDTDDAQLYEYLRQVEESLGLSDRELKVMEVTE